MLSLSPTTSWVALSLGLEKLRFVYSAETFQGHRPRWSGPIRYNLHMARNG